MPLSASEIDTLLGQLTLTEKASLLSGFGDWLTQSIARPGLSASVPSIEVGDGPHGLRKETGVDMVWIPATGFPTASALGASWDRDLVARVAAAIGEEARAQGVDIVLGPGVNMKRSPLCGRNFEYFSEDPRLSGELGVAYVHGLQSRGVGASLKHFAANNQELERTRISVEADDRTLREIYFPAFEQVVREADPWTVMCSYNRLRGEHASQNRWLLTEVLREDWKFGGAVVSDWDAVHDRVAALRAGLDLEMPGTQGRTDAEVVAAVQGGELDESVVTDAAHRVLDLVNRVSPGSAPALRAWEHSGGVVTGAFLSAMRADEHHALAREAAVGSITLLRNERRADADPTLPLTEDGTGVIAVIGAQAQHPRTQGGGSSGVEPLRVDEPLAAIRAIAGDRVSYAPGYLHLPLNAYQDDDAALLAAHGTSLDQVPGESRRVARLTQSLRMAAAVQRQARQPLSEMARRLIAEAAAVAERAETIVVFVGLPLSFEQEADDRESLALPADQVTLVQALAAVRERTGARLVVVLAAGAPVTMGSWHDAVDAIVLTGLGGQAVGSAVAEILFGRANPSGKLAETFPLALADTPGQPAWLGERGRVVYGEGVFVGYRWYDALERAVQYPFGHGLSYTSFAYSDLRTQVVDAAAGEVRVQVTVTNTGTLAGREVVQLYVGDPDAAVQRPPRELRGFEKVSLEPGASTDIEFTLRTRDFSYWDVASTREEGRPGAWRREGGTFIIEIGASSRDIRLRGEITLPDDPDAEPLVPDDALAIAPLSRFTAGYAGAAAPVSGPPD